MHTVNMPKKKNSYIRGTIMSPTVHKILIYGATIIQHALVAIGQLSEEAQEALTKDFKHIREHNTRQCSRIATNEDLLNNLLISSDPVITSLRVIHKIHSALSPV
jgi:hypothetical protein